LNRALIVLLILKQIPAYKFVNDLFVSEKDQIFNVLIRGCFGSQHIMLNHCYFSSVYILCLGFKTVSQRATLQLIVLHLRQNREGELKLLVCFGTVPSKFSCSSAKELSLTWFEILLSYRYLFATLLLLFYEFIQFTKRNLMCLYNRLLACIYFVLV